MQFDWSTLGGKSPAALVRARNLAHHAAQWVARAARANLEAVAGDAHAALDWDGARAALLSQPLAAAGGAEVRVGFRLRRCALVILRNGRDLDEFELAGRKDSSVAVWFDSALRALGLQVASGIELPYALPSLPVTRGSAYNVSGESEAFDELARWFDAGADLLGDVVAAQAAAGAVRCQPQGFDLAARLDLGDGGAPPRALSIGLSPGDDHCAQPYFFVIPSPRLKPAELPALPPPARWQTQGFVGAVLAAEDILRGDDRRALAAGFFAAAIAAGRERLAA